MFDFLFQKKNKEMQSMAEVIALDLEKLNLSKLAIEKAVMMMQSNCKVGHNSSDRQHTEKQYRVQTQCNAK